MRIRAPGRRDEPSLDIKQIIEGEAVPWGSGRLMGMWEVQPAWRGLAEQCDGYRSAGSLGCLGSFARDNGGRGETGVGSQATMIY